MTENEIAKIVVDAAYRIHKYFGPGLHETVYEVCLLYELKKQGLKVERQVAVKLQYESIVFDEAFRADLIVEDKVILEIKGVEEIHSIHRKQLLTYLRLTDMRLGLVINFDAEFIRDGIARVVNGLPEEEHDER
jgi:GxxExxY protein